MYAADNFADGGAVPVPLRPHDNDMYGILCQWRDDMSHTKAHHQGRSGHQYHVRFHTTAFHLRIVLLSRVSLRNLRLCVCREMTFHFLMALRSLHS